MQVSSIGGVSRVTNVNILMNPKIELRRVDDGGNPSEDRDVIDITEIQRTYPKKAVDEYKKALEDHRKGDSAKSLKRLQDVLKLAPDFYQVHNNLGVLYQEMEQYRDAEKEYRRAAELNPRSPQPLINLGSLFIQESDSRKAEGFKVVGKLLDDAMDCLDEAINLRPTAAMAHYYLGSAYYKSAFYKEAEASLKKSLDLDSSLGRTRLMLVNVYIKTNRWQDVLANLDAYLKENPKAADHADIERRRATVAKGLETARE